MSSVSNVSIWHRLFMIVDGTALMASFDLVEKVDGFRLDDASNT